MAAHVVTGLKEISERDVPWDQLDAAMYIRCWTEQLELEDYQKLYKHIIGERRQALKAFARELLPKYQALWENLGRPRTMEAWLKAQYKED